MGEWCAPVEISAMREYPAGLAALVDREDVPVTHVARVGQFTVFTADLFAWRLCFSEQTPCIWVEAPHMAQFSAEQLADQLQRSCLQGRWLNDVLLIFVDGDASQLGQQLAAWRYRYILLDQALQERLQTAVSPKTTLLQEVRRWRTLGELSPYEINKPVTNSRFFGQHELLNKPLQNPSTSYLFVGAHRMGKTSLLKEIKRRLDQQDPPRHGQTRRVYIDCTVISREEDLLKTLVSQLEQSGYTLVSRLNNSPDMYEEELLSHYATIHGGMITFLFDEFDRLLPHINAHWRSIKMLTQAMNEKRVRIIASGYRHAIKETLNKQSPFYNLLTPVWVEPLSKTAVKQLVLLPFNQLGIAVKDPTQFIDAIRLHTAGLPNLLQYYCRTLLTHLEQNGKSTVTVQDLEIIYRNEKFRGLLLNTFMSNTEIVERVIIYGMVIAGIDSIEHWQKETRLAELFEQHNLLLTSVQVKEACQNLRQAGIFHQQEARYTFAIPHFAKMLQQERDVQFLFDRTVEALQTELIWT